MSTKFKVRIRARINWCFGRGDCGLDQGTRRSRGRCPGDFRETLSRAGSARKYEPKRRVILARVLNMKRRDTGFRYPAVSLNA